MKALVLLSLTLAVPALALRPHVSAPHHTVERPVHNRTPAEHKESPTARERFHIFGHGGRHTPRS